MRRMNTWEVNEKDNEIFEIIRFFKTPIQTSNLQSTDSPLY